MKNLSRLSFLGALFALLYFGMLGGCVGKSPTIEKNPSPKQWLTVELTKPANIALKIGVQYVGSADQCGKFESDHYLQGAPKHSPSTVDWYTFKEDQTNVVVKIPLDMYTIDQCGMRSVAIVTSKWDPAYQPESLSSSTLFMVASAGMSRWEREMSCRKEKFAAGPKLYCVDKNYSSFVYLARGGSTIKLTYTNTQ